MTNIQWDDVKRDMDPELRDRIEQGAEALLALVSLRELLSERGFTQAEIAERLEVAQGNISRTLRRADVRVSTLRSVIEAMGGELELVARFPDATYAITGGKG